MQQSIAQWLRKVVYGERRPVKLVLRHLPIGGKVGQAIQTVEVPATTNDTWITDTARALDTAAENDAEGIDAGVQGYIVQAYDEAEEAFTRKTFRRAPPSTTDEDMAMSEPPTKQGELAQLMRHNETYARVITQLAGSVAGQQSRLIESLANERAKLDEQRIEMFETVAELMHEKSAREIAEKKAEAQIKAVSELGSAVKTVAPLIAQKMLGQKLLPSTTERTSVRALVESMDGEQMEAIRKTLKPEQLAVLMALAQEAMGNEAGETKD